MNPAANLYMFVSEGEGEKSVYVVFNLNKGAMNKISALRQGITKGIVNAPIGLVTGTYGAVTLGDLSRDTSGMIGAFRQRSATILQLNRLKDMVIGFAGGLGNDSTLTGIDEETTFTASAVCFRFKINENSFMAQSVFSNIPFDGNTLSFLDSNNKIDNINYYLQLDEGGEVNDTITNYVKEQRAKYIQPAMDQQVASQ